jgi:hypothetical protein
MEESTIEINNIAYKGVILYNHKKDKYVYNINDFILTKQFIVPTLDGLSESDNAAGPFILCKLREKDNEA